MITLRPGPTGYNFDSKYRRFVKWFAKREIQCVEIIRIINLLVKTGTLIGKGGHDSAATCLPTKLRGVL